MIEPGETYDVEYTYDLDRHRMFVKARWTKRIPGTFYEPEEPDHIEIQNVRHERQFIDRNGDLYQLGKRAREALVLDQDPHIDPTLVISKRVGEILARKNFKKGVLD